MDDESCMSDHDTFMHLHYKHDKEHFLPFGLYFQTVVQAYLYRKITQHLVLLPLCLFLHGGEGDQGILVLCPHMLAAQFISSEYRDVVSMMDGTFSCPLAFISSGVKRKAGSYRHWTRYIMCPWFIIAELSAQIMRCLSLIFHEKFFHLPRCALLFNFPRTFTNLT